MTSPDLARPRPGNGGADDRATSPAPRPPTGAGRGRRQALQDRRQGTSPAKTGRGQTRSHPSERAFTLATCRRCRQPVLAGHADGLHLVRADVQAVTPAGELAARIEGRWTLGAYRIAKGVFLVVRQDHHIRYRENHPVLAEHKCGHPAGPVDAEQSRVLFDMLARPVRKGTDKCPF